MEVLVFLLLVIVAIAPILSIVALVMAIGNRNRQAEFENAVHELKREIAQLGNRVEQTARPASGGKAAPEGAAGTKDPEHPPVAGTAPEFTESNEPEAGPAEAFRTARHSETTRPPPPPFIQPDDGPHSPSQKPPPPSTSGSDRLAPIIDLLRRANVLPPTVRERGEAGLGAWWTTRIGAVMAIIAAVFFGVYVAQDTPSWLRWIALFAFSCGVCGLGAWLERGREDVAAFGRVVFAGGLALLYFCAFAAYAIAPVRIVTTATASGVLQAVAVGLILTASLFKQREGIAVMAILLGYVSCVFAFAGDLTNFALVGAALLAVGAATVQMWREWRRPLAVALAGTWTVAALAVILLWIPGTGAVSLRFGLGVIAGGLIFFIFAESLAARGGRGFRGNASAYFHYTNSSAALFLGWLFTWQLHPESLDVFYLLFALLMLGASEEFRRRKDPVAPATGYFVKGSALAALFLVAYFAGEVRWLGILAQAACVLAVLRARRGLALELVFYGANAIAVGFFFRDMLAVGAPQEVNPILAAVFILLLGAVLAFRRRGIPDDTADRDPVIVLALLAQMTTGAAIITYAHLLFDPMGAVLRGLALALALGMMEFLTRPPRRWFAAPAMGAIYAHGVFLFGWPPEMGATATVAAGASLIALTLGAALAVALRWKQADKGARALEAGLHGVWLLSVAVVLFRTVPEPLFLLAAMLAVWAVLGMVLILRLRLLAFLSALPFFYGLALLAYNGPSVFSAAALWATALLGAGYMLVMGGLLKPIRSLLATSGLPREVADGAGGFLACAAFVVAVRETVFSEAIPVFLALGGLGIAAAWRRRNSHSWGALAAGMVLLSHLSAYGHSAGFQFHPPNGDLAAETVFLLVAVLPAAATLALALATIPHARVLNGKPARLAWSLAGAASLLLVFIAAALPVFGLTVYATAIWAGASVPVFGLGLFFKVKPFRMLALAGLGLCVLRLFAYDVQDTFYRVIAFAALGAVLLGIGYLYHRYRERIEGLTDASPKSEHPESNREPDN